MAISRCFLHFQQFYHDIFQLNIPYCVDIINNKCINDLVWALIIRNVRKISQKTPGSLNVCLSTRITSLSIVTMNDYRHFPTGPYSRGDAANCLYYTHQILLISWAIIDDPRKTACMMVWHYHMCMGVFWQLVTSNQPLLDSISTNTEIIHLCTCRSMLVTTCMACQG